MNFSLVHKLRLQEEVGMWSKNVYFYRVETVKKSGLGGQKKGQKLVNVVCERPLTAHTVLYFQEIFDRYGKFRTF